MRRFVPIVLAFATLAAPVAAQGAPAAHPDLVGTWKFDPKKSEGVGLPTSMTLTAAKDAKVMTIRRTGVTEQGEQASLVIVNLDGSPTKNTITTQGASVDLFLTGSWDGPVFVVKTKANIGGQTLDQTDRWTVGANGKTLRIATTLIGGGQTKTQTLAFDKQ
ncbi:MAG TPA: hypothetical protein VF785_23860 [Gemmatimonadaceae bacterium]